MNFDLKFIENSSMSLVLLFLCISINYIGDTLNCSLQKLFIQSRLIKYFLIFLVLFIFVVLTNPRYENENPFKILLYTVPLFIIYIISTRNKAHFVFLFLFMWFIIYFIQLYKNYKFKSLNNIKIQNYYISQNVKTNIIKNNKNILLKDINLFIFLSNTQSILYITSLIVLIIGFIYYYTLKRTEYKKNWSFKHFILGKHICKSINN